MSLREPPAAPVQQPTAIPAYPRQTPSPPANPPQLETERCRSSRISPASLPNPLGPDRRRLAAETPLTSRLDDNRIYARLKLEARKTYQRAYGTVSDEDWDAAFNMSYWKLCLADRNQSRAIEHPATWIATVAKNEIISEHRKTARQTSLTDEAIDHGTAESHDALSALDHRKVLRDVCFILNLLPPRQRRVWAARFMWDYSPQEIQIRMSISQKAYEKTLQEASSFLTGRLDGARQGVCATPEMRSLVRGYAIWGEGHYSPQRCALAMTHLESCSACRNTAWLLRASKHAGTQSSTDPPGTLLGTSPAVPIAPRGRRLARSRLARRSAVPMRRQRVLAG
jgi:RNA polymerase sigma factor (sigma-70 family)